MANPQKSKGDAAEREIAKILEERTALQVRRQLGAGRTNAAGGDVGDLAGVPHHVIQVAARSDLASVLRIKPNEAEAQRTNAGAEFAATFIRLRRSKCQPPADHWRVVLTLDQWLRYLAAARFYVASVLPQQAPLVTDASHGDTAANNEWPWGRDYEL